MGPVWEANHVWLIFVLVVFWTAFPIAVRLGDVDALRPAVPGRRSGSSCAAPPSPSRGEAATIGEARALRRDLRALLGADPVLPRHRDRRASRPAACRSATRRRRVHELAGTRTSMLHRRARRASPAPTWPPCLPRRRRAARRARRPGPRLPRPRASARRSSPARARARRPARASARTRGRSTTGSPPATRLALVLGSALAGVATLGLVSDERYRPRPRHRGGRGRRDRDRLGGRAATRLPPRRAQLRRGRGRHATLIALLVAS